MKFTVESNELLKNLKLMKGFISNNLRRPILTVVHIVANSEEEFVRFEATNNSIAAKCYLEGAEIEESGECNIEITNYFMTFLKSYKAYYPKVVIYSDGDDIKADVDGNTFKLKIIKGQYPNLEEAFDFKTIENKPLITVDSLESTIKALKSAGAKYVEIAFQDEPVIKKIKLVSYDWARSKPMKLEAITIAARRWEY